MRSRSIPGTEFRFILRKPECFFGTTDQWISEQKKATVSGLERTVRAALGLSVDAEELRAVVGL